MAHNDWNDIVRTIASYDRWKQLDEQNLKLNNLIRIALCIGAESRVVKHELKVLDKQPTEGTHNIFTVYIPTVQ